MKKFLVGSLTAAILASGVGFTVAHAADDPIATRKAIMSHVGAAARAGGNMMKGAAEFDAATAELVLRTMNAAALGFGELFPEGSETGGKTTASPKIWEDADGFKAALEKFAADTASGVAAKPADLDSFKAAFGAAAANCGTCHQSYRIK